MQCWRIFFFLLFTLFSLAVIFLSASVNYIALDWCRSAVCDISEKPVYITSLASILPFELRSASDVTRLDSTDIKD